MRALMLRIPPVSLVVLSTFLCSLFLVSAPALGQRLTIRDSGGGTPGPAGEPIGGNTVLIGYYSAKPSLAKQGDTVILSWRVEGADSANLNVSIDGLGPQPATGSVLVHPTETTTYILRADDGVSFKIGRRWVSVLEDSPGRLELSWAMDTYPGKRPDITAGVEFDVFVVANQPSGGLLGYEMSLLYSDDLVVNSVEFLTPGAYNFGVGEDNFRVGTGACVQSPGVIPLVRYSFVAFDSKALTGHVSMGPSEPSTFDPPIAAFLNCPEQLAKFEVGPPLPLGETSTDVPSINGQSQTRLLPNVPNPFNPRTEIRFELAQAGRPRLEIYDGRGRRLRSVTLPQKPAGVHGWIWDGRDDDGLDVASGVYHVRLGANDRTDTRSVSLVR